jgi:hypothetical protein
MTVLSPSDPRYGAMMAAVVEGRAKIIGERYDEDGQKRVAFEGRGLKANAQGAIRIGREFFTGAIRDYEDWREKWWREAIQNAVDAGARHIDCTVRDETVDGARGVVVSCEDDGRGMDEDTIINKFLVLGGTTKVVAGTTGGFGKAKELLLLPWIRWRIESRETVVEGSGIEYDVSRAAESMVGTKITVVMPLDQCTESSAAIAYIKKCFLPSVKFKVHFTDPAGRHDRVDVLANAKAGEAVRDFGDAARLYYDKKYDGDTYQLLVRANGLYMFASYIGSTPGRLIVELLRPSIDLLTANRDGFRDRELRREVESYIGELAKDVKSALRTQKGLIRKKYVSGKRFRASQREIEAAMFEHSADFSAADKVGAKLGQRAVAGIMDILQMGHNVGDGPAYGETDVPPGPVRLYSDPEAARAMLEATPMLGPTHVENAIKQLAWEPDFFLVNEIEGFKVPKKFFPEEMPTRIRQILQFWAELCRFVMLQLGSGIEYGVGFLFSEDARGQYIHEDGQHWLMLNPMKEADPRKSDMFKLTSKDDVNWIYAISTHECTHIADGITYHDESFAAALTRNMARTANRSKQIEVIRKSVTKRGA